MTIADLGLKDKPYTSFLVLLAFLLAGSAGVGTGFLMAHDRAGKEDRLWIEQLPAVERSGGVLVATSTAVKARQTATTQTAAAAAAVPRTGEVIASKSGTVYYLPTCSGVSRILPANRVTYASRAEAEAKGLKLAKNCKGL